MSFREMFYHVMQALLEVVNDLFEEQTDLEKVVKKIMHRAQTLLKCERCSVLLLEDIESPVSCLPSSISFIINVSNRLHNCEALPLYKAHNRLFVLVFLYNISDPLL